MKTIEIKTVEINKEIVTEVHCDRCGALLFEEGACDAEGKPNPGAIPVHCHIVSTDHVDLDFSPTELGSSDVSKNKHIYESCDDCISDMVKEIMDGTFVSIYDETGTPVGKARTRMLNTRGKYSYILNHS